MRLKQNYSHFVHTITTVTVTYSVLPKTTFRLLGLNSKKIHVIYQLGKNDVNRLMKGDPGEICITLIENTKQLSACFVHILVQFLTELNIEIGQTAELVTFLKQSKH